MRGEEYGMASLSTHHGSGAAHSARGKLVARSGEQFVPPDRGAGRDAVLSVLAESAIAEAETADGELAVGRWRGPLHGVPIGVKDLIDVRGAACTAGMPILNDRRPDRDAHVIAPRSAGSLRS